MRNPSIGQGGAIDPEVIVWKLPMRNPSFWMPGTPSMRFSSLEATYEESKHFYSPRKTTISEGLEATYEESKLV